MLRGAVGIGAVAAAALFASTSANAAVFIGLQEAGVNGGAITQVSTGAGNTIFSGGYGVFDINNLSATVAVFPNLLDSTALDQISSGVGGTLHIFVTETGLTNPLGTKPFLSSLTMNQLSSGWSVVQQTFLDTSNALWGTGTSLASHTFSGIGTYQESDTVATGEGPYSVTQEISITAPGAGNASSTIDISAAPEPATWLMMILGVFGVGAMLRRRRAGGQALVAA